MSRWIVGLAVGTLLLIGGISSVVIAGPQHPRIFRHGSTTTIVLSTPGHSAALTLGWAAVIAGAIVILVSVIGHRTRNAPPRP